MTENEKRSVAERRQCCQMQKCKAELWEITEIVPVCIHVASEILQTLGFMDDI